MIPKAIIFDFDGVIADTMSDNLKAWQMAFENYGIKIEALDYYLLEGMGRFDIARKLTKTYNFSDSEIQNIVISKEANYRQINQFRFYDEIESILSIVKNGQYKIGLVTGASRDRIQNTLTIDIKDYFDNIITADDVENGKPNPEPYIKSCELLGVLPENAIVIENARLGIQSAKSAGCKCYAIETTLNALYLQEADLIFKNHHLLLNYFSDSI